MATQEDYQFMAWLAHEANANYCRATSSTITPTPWVDMAEEAKAKLVETIKRIIADKVAGQGNSPRKEHELWCQAKQADGWQYGETYNLEEKLHPNLVPYEELPAVEKAKDVVFLTLIYSLMATLARERQVRTDECFADLLAEATAQDDRNDSSATEE